VITLHVWRFDVATEMLMPQLGMGMFQGTIVRWMASDGATVKRGDPLVEIQTEKVIHTIEAALDGVVQRVAVEGATIPIRGLIGYLLAPGEGRVVSGDEVGQATSVPSAAGHVPETHTAQPKGEVRASPIARRLAAEHDVDLTTLLGSGPGGRIVEKDVLAAVEARRKSVAPAPAPLLDEGGQRSTATAARDELEQALRGAPTPSAAPVAVVPAEAESVPVVGIRQVIFDRMGQSARTVARVTEFTEVDATALVELRTQLKAEIQKTEGISVSYNDLLIMIVARALREHRLLNGTFVDGALKLLPHINVGLAVDTERGLLVPVIRNADTLGLLGIIRESRKLIERAQSGKSLPDDLSGGTFTITNLGMYEVDGFTPIVNLPECAILGVGRIQAKPVVYGGEITIRQMMVLSLSFDHRLVDGAPAARFLQRVKQLVENSCLLLM
jgi:pyruvate dehydrogenase E2 component (dihydrolipoamide acetyltransferase)